MARRLKVMLLVHPYFRPDRRGPARSASERDVWHGLKTLGYHRAVSCAQSSLKDLERDLVQIRPDVVFNLLEEFEDEGVLDFYPVSFLNSRGVPVTGCNPVGLIVSRHKYWSAQVTTAAGVQTPPCRLWGNFRDGDLQYPVFLKYNSEHASLGITTQNRASTWASARLRAMQMKAQHGDAVLVQEFIAGREYNVSVWGNDKPYSLPPFELYLGNEKAFATEKIKFSRKEQRRRWILARMLRHQTKLAEKLKAGATRAYRALGLSGYARMDFRVNSAGEIFLIDANANPNLARGEDFHLAARAAGLSYGDVLQEIIRLGRG